MTGMLAGSTDRSPPSAAEYANTASNEVQTAHADVMQTDPGRNAGFHISTGLSVRNVRAAQSRYGQDGWACTEGQPDAGDQPVGGTYLKERCTKTISGRSLVVERNLFRRPDQDIKNFVDETRISIRRVGD
jgi:hypothetical protein